MKQHNGQAIHTYVGVIKKCFKWSIDGLENILNCSESDLKSNFLLQSMLLDWKIFRRRILNEVFNMTTFTRSYIVTRSESLTVMSMCHLPLLDSLGGTSNDFSDCKIGEFKEIIDEQCALAVSQERVLYANNTKFMNDSGDYEPVISLKDVEEIMGVQFND